MKLKDILFGVGLLILIAMMSFVVSNGYLKDVHESRCQQVCFDKGYPDARADTHLWDWTATCECIKIEKE